MSRFSPEYLAYIKSEAWQLMRRRKIAQVGERCQRCRRTKAQLHPGEWLEVHHLTYVRLRHEWLSDLQVLCNTCHKIVTAESRSRRTVRRFFGV